MSKVTSKKKNVLPKFSVGDIVELRIVQDISRGGQVSMETGICRILLIERDGIVIRKNGGEGLQIVDASVLRPLDI